MHKYIINTPKLQILTIIYKIFLKKLLKIHKMIKNLTNLSRGVLKVYNKNPLDFKAITGCKEYR